MTCFRSGALALTALLVVVGCSGVSETGRNTGGAGGSGGSRGTGGSAGAGGSAGTGGTGGSDSSLSLALKAAKSEVDPGAATELSWTVKNATSCEASGGWSGEKSEDGASESVSVFRETTYTMTCVDADADEVSSSVTVFVSGRLMATLMVSPNPAEGGERGLATVTVSNPSDEPVDDVEVSLKIPDEHVEDLSPDDYSPGGVCSDPGACGAGDTITWYIGTLQVGEVVTLFVFPTISELILPGTTLDFELMVDAPDEPMTRRVATTQQGERSLALSMEQGSSKALAGEQVDYSLHYANATTGLLEDVVIIMVLPLSTTLESASAGATMMDAQTIQWSFAELQPGQGGTLKANVTIDDNLPEGAQLFASAEGEVDGQKTLATTTTGVSSEKLFATTQVSPDRVKAGDMMRVDVTASNRGLATMQDVEIAVRIPDGLEALRDSRLSDGGRCPGTVCNDPGELASWPAVDIPAGESVTVSLFPVAASDLLELVPFEALISIAGELALQTSATAVQANRVLELRLTESDNPVQPEQKLTYALNVANQDNATVNGNLTARVPNGTSFLRASHGGTVDANGVVHWPLTQLQPRTGTARQFEVEVGADVPLGSQLRAEATALVNGSTDDARATKHTPVSATGLKASVGVNPDPAKSGELTSVNVTVSNPGTEPANDVIVDLRTPQYLEAIRDDDLSAGGSCAGTICNEPGDVVHWDVGTIPAGASTTLTLPPVVDSAAPDGALISFDAEVRATDEVSVFASATTMVDGERPLELQLVQSQSPVQPGTLLLYTLHFGNQSGGVLSGTLTLTVPDGTSFSAASDGGLHDADESLVTWDITQLQNGQGGTRQLAVAVDDDLPEGTQLKGLASAQVGSDSGDRAQARATNPVGAVSLVASVDVVPDPVNPGQAGLVSVAVSNPTASVVNDVTVDVRIPDHLEAIRSGANTQISSGGTCPGTICNVGDRVSWPARDNGGVPISPLSLGPGEAKTFTFPPIVSLGTDNGTLVSFQAEVNATDEAPLIANAATAVYGTKPLDLRVHDSGYPVAPGAVLTYIVHYGNLSGVTVSGPLAVALPPRVTFLSASDGGTHNAGVVTWTLSLVPAGGGGSRTFAVEVADDEPEGSQLKAFATAAVDNGDGARVRANAHTTVAVSSLVAKARIDSPGAPEAVQSGETMTVSVQVTNTTVDAVTDVFVEVSIPQGLLDVRDADLSPGGSCPGTLCSALRRAHWDVGTLAAGESRTVSFEATVANSILPGSLIPFEAEAGAGSDSVAGATATASVCDGATCPAAPGVALLHGAVNDSLTLGAGQANEKTITSAAGVDHGASSGYSAWLASYDSAHELEWAAQISPGDAEGTGFARITSADKDEAGHVYVTVRADVFPGTISFVSADGNVIDYTPAYDAGSHQYVVAKIDPDGVWQWYAPIEAEVPGVGSAYIQPASTSVYAGRIYVTGEHGYATAGQTLRISDQSGITLTPAEKWVHPVFILNAATGAYIDHRITNSTTVGRETVMRHNRTIPISPGMFVDSITTPTVGSVGPSGWYDGSSGFHSRVMNIVVNAGDGPIAVPDVVQAGVLVRRDLDGNAAWAYMVNRGGGNTSVQSLSTIGAALETGDGVIFLGGVDKDQAPEFNSVSGVVALPATIDSKSQYLVRYAQDGTIRWLTHINAGSKAGHGLTAGRPENRSVLYDPVADRVYAAYAMPPWPDMGIVSGGTFFKFYNDALGFGPGEATEETFTHIGDDGLIILAAFDGIDGAFLWATSHRRADKQIAQPGPAGVFLDEAGEVHMLLVSGPGTTSYGDNKTPLPVNHTAESLVVVRHGIVDGSVLGVLTLEDLGSSLGSETIFDGVLAKP